MAPNQGKHARLLEELRSWCFSPEAISTPGSILVLGGAAASLPHPAAPQTLPNAIWRRGMTRGHRASSGGEAKPQLAGGAGVRGAGGGEAWNNSTTSPVSPRRGKSKNRCGRRAGIHPHRVSPSAFAVPLCSARSGP